jgi:hypothetical protein
MIRRLIRSWRLTRIGRRRGIVEEKINIMIELSKANLIGSASLVLPPRFVMKLMRLQFRRARLNRKLADLA